MIKNGLIRLFAAFVSCLPVLEMAACSVNPATGKNSFTAFMPQEQEAAIGRSEHPKILQSFGGEYDSRDLAAYVDRAGKSLAAVSELPNLNFTFTVLNDSIVNAFALPGGYVYISRGLLALADNEAEMAGVLAHEIGHVAARHAAQRFSAAQAANIGLAIVNILSAPDDPDSGGIGAGQLLSAAAQLALQGYSREQEMESDMLAVRYLVRAGYSPDAMSSFFHKLQAHAELMAAESGNPLLASQAGSIFSTHPRTSDRINQAIALAGAAPKDSNAVKRDIFLRRLDGLMFGDDPKQGIIKGQRFIHGGLGITFKAPPGFALSNHPDKVIARGPAGAAIVFDVENGAQAAMIHDLGGYLADEWGQGVAMDEIRPVDVNGLPAAIAQGHVRTKDGGFREIHLAAIRESRDRLYRFLFSQPLAFSGRYEYEFQQTIGSFRRITPHEAAAMRPMRIEVRKASERDTAAGLAARMPLDKNAQRWFEVINGKRPGQPLVPGEMIKVIVN